MASWPTVADPDDPLTFLEQLDVAADVAMTPTVIPPELIPDGPTLTGWRDGPLFPADVWDAAIDPTLPPGVISHDGQRFPIVEFNLDDGPTDQR